MASVIFPAAATARAAIRARGVVNITRLESVIGFSSRLGAFFALLQPLYISQATAEFKVFGALMAVDERKPEIFAAQCIKSTHRDHLMYHDAKERAFVY